MHVLLLFFGQCNGAMVYSTRCPYWLSNFTKGLSGTYHHACLCFQHKCQGRAESNISPMGKNKLLTFLHFRDIACWLSGASSKFTNIFSSFCLRNTNSKVSNPFKGHIRRHIYIIYIYIYVCLSLINIIINCLISISIHIQQRRNFFATCRNAFYLYCTREHEKLYGQWVERRKLKGCIPVLVGIDLPEIDCFCVMSFTQIASQTKVIILTVRETNGIVGAWKVGSMTINLQSYQFSELGNIARNENRVNKNQVICREFFILAFQFCQIRLPNLVSTVTKFTALF